MNKTPQLYQQWTILKNIHDHSHIRLWNQKQDWAPYWPGQWLLMSKVTVGHEIKTKVGMWENGTPASLSISWPAAARLIKNELWVNIVLNPAANLRIHCDLSH